LKFYQQHHDYIIFHQQRKQGVRTLTIFLYLNDVELGGGTNFPLLNNLTVLPKKGKALVWPSVLDEDPNAKDHRTDHQALPVEKGKKYGANAWIHQRDFKEPFARACI
jgi:prolyl 4-hydroxylase